MFERKKEKWILCLWQKAVGVFLDSFVVSPSITLGVSTYNKKNGNASGPKSITLCGSTTLYRLIIMIVGLMLLMRALSLFFQMKTGFLYQRKMRKKRKMKRKS